MDRRILVGLAAAGVLIAGAVVYLYFLPEGSTRMDEALPPAFADARVVAEGSFSGADALHSVSGTVKLLEAEGQYLLRFEGYEATDGPDVYLYLVRDPQQTSTREVETEGVRLYVPGGAEGHATVRGAFNVPVPEGVDPTAYGGLAVWCDRFDTLFGRAVMGRAG